MSKQKKRGAIQDLDDLETMVAIGKPKTGKYAEKDDGSDFSDSNVDKSDDQSESVVSDSSEKKPAKKGPATSKAKAATKEPKGPTKKELKEQDKAAELAKRSELDKLPLFKKFGPKEIESGLGQLETVVQNALKTDILDLAAFYTKIQDFEQSGKTEIYEKIVTRLSKFLIDKKASPQLCLSVMKALMDRLQQKPLFHQSMFFPSSQNVKDMAQVIRRAEKTVDCCVFAFTNDILAEALTFVFQRGVKVRVIADDECAKFNGADIWRLGLIGVPCTTDNNKMAHMHNKYCLIDSQILITGSFNWTSQAVTTNQENLIILHDPVYVKEYQVNFEELWEKFKPQLVTKEICQGKLDEEMARIKNMQEKAAITRALKKEEKDKATL